MPSNYNNFSLTKLSHFIYALVDDNWDIETFLLTRWSGKKGKQFRIESEYHLCLKMGVVIYTRSYFWFHDYNSNPLNYLSPEWGQYVHWYNGSRTVHSAHWLRWDQIAWCPGAEIQLFLYYEVDAQCIYTVQHTCTFCGYVKPKINYLSRQHFPIKSIGSFSFDIKKGELIVRKTSWHLLLKIEQWRINDDDVLLPLNSSFIVR